MNKRGEIVLRDIVIMLFLASGIVIFASIFVDEEARVYGNTEMQDEFAGSTFNIRFNDSFYDSKTNVEKMGNATETGLGSLVSGGLQTAKVVLSTVFLAPNTFGNMIRDALIDINVPLIVANPIGIIIKVLLYILIVFVIVSAFLQGGKL